MSQRLRGLGRSLTALMSVLFLVTIVSPAIPRASAQAVDCTVSDILVNPCRPWLGANVNGYPGVSGFANNIVNHEARIGRQLDVVHDYLAPTESVSADDLALASRANTYLMLNWKPATSWASAAGGNATVNAKIDSIAQSLKSVAPKKLFLTVFHEPENNVSKGGSPSCGSSVSYKGNAGTTADYVNMWHNVRARFDALGVTNVVWVMNYMGYTGWNCMLDDLWPGNNYVDWVVWDKYLGASGDPVGTYSVFYNELTSISDTDHDYLSKPWGLNEWGDGSGTQAVVKSEYAGMKSIVDNNTFPKLKLYDVFDNNTGADFRLTYTSNGVFDASEQAAYNAFADDPVFTDTPPITTGDTTAPAARIDGPTDQSSVTGTVAVSGGATDDTGVASISLMVDGAYAQTIDSNGSFDNYTVDWDSTSVANGTHTLVFEATDATGNAGYSTPITVTVENPDTTAPSVPDGLQASGVDASTLQVSWNASYDVNGVTGYNVYRDGSLVTTLTDGSTTYTDSSVAAGQVYQYTVSAFDAAGNTSDQSAPVLATAQDTVAPSTPSSLTATLDSGDVDLSWQASSDNVGVTSYDVLRNGTVIGSVTDTNYVDAAVPQGQNYTYTIQAHDAAGNTSGTATMVTLTVPDTTAPSAPGKPSVKLNSTQTAVVVSWSAATDNVGVKYYAIWRNGVYVTRVNGTTLSFTDTDVAQGSSYTYQIYALDAANNRSAASLASASIKVADTTAPTAPTGLTGTSTVTGTAKLTWKASSDNVGVTGYNVYRGTTKIATVSGSTLTYTKSGLNSGGAYKFTVEAVDAAGNVSPMSTQITVNVK